MEIFQRSWGFFLLCLSVCSKLLSNWPRPGCRRRPQPAGTLEMKFEMNFSKKSVQNHRRLNAKFSNASTK